MAQTPDGFLWVGTNGGLARFDGLKFRTFLQDAPAALRHRITDLGVDADGTLWIGTSTGLFKYGGLAFTPVSLGKKTVAVEQILCTGGDRRAWVRDQVRLIPG